jgi:hypothetical protein
MGEFMSQAVSTLLAWYRGFLEATNQAHSYGNLSDTPEVLLDLLSHGKMQASAEALKESFPAMMRVLLEHGGSVSAADWRSSNAAAKLRVTFFNRTNLRNSVMFDCASNHVGTTTGLVEKGDSVVSHTCCEVPIILRPRGEHWQYVGPAYNPNMKDSALWPSKNEDLSLFSLI